MKTTHLLGIDPGLVHTGLVSMIFYPSLRRILIRELACNGLAPEQVVTAVGALAKTTARPMIFIEGYRPRSNLNSDKRMTVGVSELHKALPGSRVLQNMGVKKVIKQPLMELLGVWNFSTLTHHQDLRSAARIALLGGVKDDDVNALLFKVVEDHLAGKTWSILQ